MSHHSRETASLIIPACIAISSLTQEPPDHSPGGSVYYSSPDGSVYYKYHLSLPIIQVPTHPIR